eukprot:15362073-Ditylum_brightwellii.AAC.1
MEVDKDEKDPDEALPIEEKGESLTEEIYDEMEEIEEGEYLFETKDEPTSLAKCIKRYVAKASRQNGTSNMWAPKGLKENARALRQLYQIRKMDRAFGTEGTKVSRRNRQLVRRNILDTKDCPTGAKVKYQ